MISDICEDDAVAEDPQFKEFQGAILKTLRSEFSKLLDEELDPTKKWRRAEAGRAAYRGYVREIFRTLMERDHVHNEVYDALEYLGMDPDDEETTSKRAIAVVNLQSFTENVHTLARALMVEEASSLKRLDAEMRVARGLKP